MQTIKCVTVGDGGVGKSSMLISYLNGGFTQGEYIPTIFDNFASTINIADRQIRLELWDTAGQEDYDRLRPLSYPKTDVFLLCFSVVNYSSFKNIELKWILELRHLCSHAKIILIGTKKELRSNPGILLDLIMRNEKPVAYSEGLAMAKQIGAVKYFECSAITREGLLDIFDAAAEVILYPSVEMRRRKLCNIL